MKEDSNQIEENKLKSLAEYIKKETNIDAIIISNKDLIFNENISKVYELNPQINYKNNYFICYNTKQEINEHKTLKEKKY